MNTPLPNGSKKQPPGAVGNVAHFLRDAVALVELQAILLLMEVADELRRARNGLLLIVILTGLGLSCLPLGLAGLALLIAEHTRLSIAEALLAVALAGLAIACAGIYAAVRWVKPGPESLRRSRCEWSCNVNWIKETLKHLGDRHDPDPTRIQTGTQYERMRR